MWSRLRSGRRGQLQILILLWSGGVSLLEAAKTTWRFISHLKISSNEIEYREASVFFFLFVLFLLPWKSFHRHSSRRSPGVSKNKKQSKTNKKKKNSHKTTQEEVNTDPGSNWRGSVFAQEHFSHGCWQSWAMLINHCSRPHFFPCLSNLDVWQDVEIFPDSLNILMIPSTTGNKVLKVFAT